MTRSHRRRLRRLVVASLLAGAVLPATAAADSIVHLKDGDVWLSEPDGSRSSRVTTDGGWTAVSQGEDGTIVAGKSRKLYRLARTGGVVGELTTAMGSANWNGPYDIDVSPDGRRVAYGFLYQRVFDDPTCPGSPEQCRSTSVFSGVAYSTTAGPAAGVPAHTGWSYPAWVDDEALVHSFADGVLNEETILRPFGSANSTGEPWFTHRAFDRMLDATVRGGTLAFVGPGSAQVLAVAHVAGRPGAGARVDDCFAYQQPTGRFASPTLAPGTQAMAWAEGDGIWRGDFGGDPSDGCDAPPGPARLVIPGGSAPDWGPADVPADRTPPADGPKGGDAPAPGGPGTGSAPGTGTGTGKGTGPGTGSGTGSGSTGSGTGTGSGAARATLTVRRAPLAGALSRGLALTVTGAPAGPLRATARIDAATARRAGLGRRTRTVATGAATAAAGRATAVRLRFGRATARRLGRLRTVVLTVSVAGTTQRVTLRR